MPTDRRPMWPTRLAELYREHQPQGHFFDPETLRRFGDNMMNYAVTQSPIVVVTHAGIERPAWELRRLRPTRHGHTQPAYFDAITYQFLAGACPYGLRYEQQNDRTYKQGPH